MYEAFGARDEPRLRTLIHDDVEWNQCDGFPGGARRRGLEAVIAAVFAKNRATWLGFEAKVEELLECGDRVVALGHYAGTHGETGKPMHAVFAHVYRIHQGQIIRYDQIADTWPMIAATMADAPPVDDASS